MEREEALELSVALRTMKDLHIAQRGQYDCTAEVLAKAERYFKEIADKARDEVAA